MTEEPTGDGLKWETYTYIITGRLQNYRKVLN